MCIPEGKAPILWGVSFPDTSHGSGVSAGIVRQVEEIDLEFSRWDAGSLKGATGFLGNFEMVKIKKVLVYLSLLDSAT